MRTKEQYVEGLRKMKRNLYFDGNRIDRDDEAQLPALNVMGFTFDAPHIPEIGHLCTVKFHLTGEAVFDEQEMLCNIAGGLPSTFPYEADLANPDLRPLLEKYLKRNPKIPIADQLKFWLLFAEVTCSSNTGFMTYGSYHGGGSPIMEQIAITMQYDVKLREHIVNAAAGIEKLDISRIAKI
jgi:aromatic ring hydroxylase